MCDSSSSASEGSISKSSSLHSEMKKDLKRGSYLSKKKTEWLPANKDDASLPIKSIEERTKKADTPVTVTASKSRRPGSKPQADDEDRKKNKSDSVRPRSKYTTNTQLIRRKLEQLKVEMQKLSEKHRCTFPERKAFHPFVWNSLSPYTNTAEIDYLLAKSSGNHGGDRRASKTMRTEKVHLSH